VVVPAVEVLGVGAVALAEPPTAIVYHFKEVPLADNAEAVAPAQ
jgi:hypothetical protein